MIGGHIRKRTPESTRLVLLKEWDRSEIGFGFPPPTGVVVGFDVDFFKNNNSFGGRSVASPLLLFDIYMFLFRTGFFPLKSTIFGSYPRHRMG